MTEAEVKAIADTSAKEAIDKYFKDIDIMPVSDWAAQAWNKAVESGVFDGKTPRGVLTREQAAMVFGKMGILELNSTMGTSGWAKEAWGRMVGKGLLDGSNPREAVTREQLAMILDKLTAVEEPEKTQDKKPE